MQGLSANFLNSPAFKLLLLTGMVLQNSSVVLIGRYSRRPELPRGDLYVVNHLILVTEIGKLILSFAFEHVTTGGQLMQSIQQCIIDQPYDAMKIMVPALLYLVQNSLMYVALSNLSAPLFQVTYQGKLVTTAIVSVLMLNRKYTAQQWICLVALSLGVAIVVLGEGEEPPETKGVQSLSVGLASVTISCLCSALAGVYFEKVVKNVGAGSEKEKAAPVSVWIRNVELAFFTIVIAIVQGWTSSKPETKGLPYFHGFTGWVWLIVALQAGGGMLVAAIIKYADNVLKGLATGVSVCVATAASAGLFGTPIGGQFTIGATLILVSVYVFSNPIGKKKPSTGSSLGSPSQDDDDDKKPILPK